MKLKPLSLALSVAFSISLLVSVEASASSNLASLFDSVQTSDPRAVSNEHGNVFTGGNVRIRTARASYDVASFTPPSITSGCGGIDIFAGSFGVISKDQLVQTGRALVQGAASYYFGLALSAICPLCNGEMSKLQDKLDQMNQFSRMSCDQATSAIEDWSTKTFGTSLESEVDKINEGQGGIWSGLLGLSDSQVTQQLTRDESQPGTAAGLPMPVAEMILLGNSVYMIITNQQIPDNNGIFQSGSVFNPGLFGDTPIDAVNLFMSLTGTMISIEDTSQDSNYRSFPIAPAFTVSDYFGLESDPIENPTLQLHECDSVAESSPAKRCISVTKGGGELIKPLSHQIRDIVHGEPGTFGDGIFDRILDENGHRELTNKQKNLLNMFGMDPYGVAALMVTMGISRESIGNYIEHSLMKAIHSALSNELGRLVAEMDAATLKTENQVLRQDALARFQKLVESISDLGEPLENNFTSAQREISSQAELNVFELHFKAKRTNN